MNELSRIGRILFAVAMAAFGMQYLSHIFLGGPVPGPPWGPGHHLWVYLTVAVLIGASTCIVTGKKVACAGTVLAIMLVVRGLLVYAPRLAANLHDPGPWTSGFE